MSEWTIDVRTELGEERVKAICEEELREALDWWFRNGDRMETIISNAIYHVILRQIKEQWDGDLDALTREKVQEHIVNMASYDVISGYSHKTEAYKIIEEESHNARPLIREMVEKHIREYDFHELERDEIGDVIWEVIMNKILKPEEKDGVEDKN